MFLAKQLMILFPKIRGRAMHIRAQDSWRTKEAQGACEKCLLNEVCCKLYLFLVITFNIN